MLSGGDETLFPRIAARNPIGQLRSLFAQLRRCPAGQWAASSPVPTRSSSILAEHDAEVHIALRQFFVPHGPLDQAGDDLADRGESMKPNPVSRPHPLHDAADRTPS